MPYIEIVSLIVPLLVNAYVEITSTRQRLPWFHLRLFALIRASQLTIAIRRPFICGTIAGSDEVYLIRSDPEHLLVSLHCRRHRMLLLDLAPSTVLCNLAGRLERAQGGLAWLLGTLLRLRFIIEGVICAAWLIWDWFGLHLVQESLLTAISRCDLLVCSKCSGFLKASS